jgi:hypothetical protein
MPPGVPPEAWLATCRVAETGVPPLAPGWVRPGALAAAAAAAGDDGSADPLARPLALPGFDAGGGAGAGPACAAKLPAAVAAHRAGVRAAVAAAGAGAGSGTAADDVAARNRVFGATQAAARTAALLSSPAAFFTSTGAQQLEGTVMATL